MKEEHISVSEKKIAGFKVRTSNAKEMSTEDAKIPRLVEKFYKDNPLENLVDKVDSSAMYAVYTNYESDADGEYDYILGLEVSSLDNLPANTTGLTIPEREYVKVTTSKGPLPENLINAWHFIWKSPTTRPLGNRAYTLDFEIYDERTANPQLAEIDIFIATK